jgi:hypothetical protein
MSGESVSKGPEDTPRVADDLVVLSAPTEEDGARGR